MKMWKVRCLLTVALKFVTWGWFSPLICFHIFGRVEPVTLPLSSSHSFEKLQYYFWCLREFPRLEYFLAFSQGADQQIVTIIG